MKKRNWYDLSDEEIEKLENAWKDSDWYKRAKKDSKKMKFCISHFSISQYVIIILSIAFISIGFYFMNRYFWSEEINPEIFIFSYIIGFILLIVGVINEIRIKKEYVEKEKIKWLSEKHNVIK